MKKYKIHLSLLFIFASTYVLYKNLFSGKINAIMAGHVNNFEEWYSGGQFILVEPSPNAKKIPRDIKCCENRFTLYGRYLGKRTYERGYEFTETGYVYQYDSFLLLKN